jgi:hypothetical protein
MSLQLYRDSIEVLEDFSDGASQIYSTKLWNQELFRDKTITQASIYDLDAESQLIFLNGFYHLISVARLSREALIDACESLREILEFYESKANFIESEESKRKYEIKEVINVQEVDKQPFYYDLDD